MVRSDPKRDTGIIISSCVCSASARGSNDLFGELHNLRLHVGFSSVMVFLEAGSEIRAAHHLEDPTLRRGFLR